MVIAAAVEDWWRRREERKRRERGESDEQPNGIQDGLYTGGAGYQFVVRNTEAYTWIAVGGYEWQFRKSDGSLVGSGAALECPRLPARVEVAPISVNLPSDWSRG